MHRGRSIRRGFDDRRQQQHYRDSENVARETEENWDDNDTPSVSVNWNTAVFHEDETKSDLRSSGNSASSYEKSRESADQTYDKPARSSDRTYDKSPKSSDRTYDNTTRSSDSYDMLDDSGQLSTTLTFSRSNKFQEHSESGGTRSGRNDVRQNARDVDAGESEMRVPQNMIGMVIGKGGSRIRELQDRSGSKINVDKQCDNDGNMLITILGTGASRSAAKNMIEELLKSESRGLGSFRDQRSDGRQYGDGNRSFKREDDGRQHGDGNRSYKREDDVQESEPGRSYDQRTETMAIPVQYVGRIIGRGGSIINELRETTGAMISVPRDNTGPTAVVTISGNDDVRAHAQKLISDLIPEFVSVSLDSDSKGEREVLDTCRSNLSNARQTSQQNGSGWSGNRNTFSGGGERERQGWSDKPRQDESSFSGGGERERQGWSDKPRQDESSFSGGGERDRQGFSDKPRQAQSGYNNTFSGGGERERQGWSDKPRQTQSSYNNANDGNGHDDSKKGVIDWDKVREGHEMYMQTKWKDFPDVKKDFYIEDEDVANLEPETVERIRRDNNKIMVQHLHADSSQRIPNPVQTFAEAFGHFPEIMREIKKAGFVKPSPIQMQAWPIILQGSDLIGIAQTGTGKTLAFLLPAFLHIEGQPASRDKRGGANVLILTPTRELALQIEEEVKKYQYRGIKCVCVYGGGNRREQISVVTSGVEVIVATPGRLIDLIQNNIVDVRSVTYLILDEADRMLDLGFQPDIRKILLDIRPERQTIMTSATWPPGVRYLASNYMNNPIQVFVGSMDLTACHSVVQQVIMVEEDKKLESLLDLLENEVGENYKIIVFMGRKNTVDYVSTQFVFKDIPCQSIHGGREQSDREQALDDLKNGSVRILLATDVASRGIDIRDVTHVINYDFPHNIEEYVHRVGRTGRAGRSGQSITFMTRSDWRYAKELIEIMEEAKQEVPQSLYDMASRFSANQERRQQEGGGRFNRRGGGGRSDYDDRGRSGRKGRDDDFGFSIGYM